MMSTIYFKGGSRDLEKGERSMSVTMVGRRKERKKKQKQNNVRNYKFLEKYFCQYFQIFSIFFNKILSVFQNLLTR